MLISTDAAAGRRRPGLRAGAVGAEYAPRHLRGGPQGHPKRRWHVYSGSKKKIAEHGGFAADDTHSALVLSSPISVTVTEHVTNQQVAPTILRALGLNPSKLDAVRLEGTEVLPEFGEE